MDRMGKKKKGGLKKWIGDGTGWIGIKILLALVNIWPLSYLHCLGERLGRLVFLFWGKRKKIVLKNLELALGKERSERELRDIFKSSIENIGKGILETIRYPHLSFEQIDKIISVEGKEHLDGALEAGKGVIALSAHLGNFTLIGKKMSSLGYQFSVIFRNPENKKIAQLARDLIRQIGTNGIPDKPRKICVSQSIKMLRNNGILFLQIDQNTRAKSGVFVDFFGYSVPTFTGPVVMALRTGAAIVPIFIVRNDDNTHKIIIDPPVKLELSGDKDRDIVANIARLTKISESYIRRYPEQWWWVHRRFRKAKKAVIEQ